MITLRSHEDALIHNTQYSNITAKHNAFISSLKQFQETLTDLNYTKLIHIRLQDI